MPTIAIADMLTAADNKKHIEHPFDVPPGAIRLALRFEHSPEQATGQNIPNQISLSLFDPNGFRGTRHNSRDQNPVITEKWASPGYLPGRIPAGKWTVVIDTHRILPPDPVTYRITVDISLDGHAIEEPAVEYAPAAVDPRGAGWYRGDLHGHSIHSDGKWDIPDLVRAARDLGLDFVALSDHNTVSGLAQLDSLAGDDLLTIGGEELTTYYGHALVLGTRQWHDWRSDDKRTMYKLASAALKTGAFFVIAHPRAPGDPECTGCDWQHADMMPGNAPAVEIWNGPWSDYNQAGLELYYQWLNAGHRLVATAGTDVHGPPLADRSGVEQVGFNVVYAEALTEPAIIEGIRQGHTYLSSGPELDVTASTASGNTYMIGDKLPNANTVDDDEITISAAWKACTSDDRLRLICDGSVYASVVPSANGSHAWTFERNAYKWCLIEVRDAQGKMRAITNPIYLRPQS